MCSYVCEIPVLSFGVELYPSIQMEEELVVVLNRRDDPTAGLGFSLLDKPGFPPVIYDIEENSPAAECGKVRPIYVKIC